MQARVGDERHNFFDVKEEFFLIDSDNLDFTSTKIYGFSVQLTGIYENHNLTSEAIKGMNGCGVYVLVEVNENEIKIRQDYNGSYGIYLFKQESYFAISNSFWRLLEHVKDKEILTLNVDYANGLLTDYLTSLAYGETPVKEIELLDKDIVVTIDKKKKQLTLKREDYKDYQLVLDSLEGIETLDNWFTRWTTVFRNIHNRSGNITVTLSGGFDSRIPFMLMLKSGVNLNDICVFSIKNNLKTHEEDFKIASEIADYFKFSLNKPLAPNRKLNFSLEDIINICLYNKMPFHKEMYFKYGRTEDKRFTIPGAGGESVRAHWDVSASEFIKEACSRANRNTSKIRENICDSITRIIKKGYDRIYEKYGIEDRESLLYPLFLYREVRCRNHFGKSEVDDYFSNCLYLTPLIDPDLRKIQLNSDECKDNNLLMALIYVRYCPELLKFKFDGNRKIDEQTIATAKRINSKYKKYEFRTNIIDENFALIMRDDETSSALKSYNNKSVTIGEPEKYFKRIFDSATLKNIFKSELDGEFLECAELQTKISNYHPLRDVYSVVVLTGVIERIIASRTCKGTIADFNSYLNNNSRYIDEEGIPWTRFIIFCNCIKNTILSNPKRIITYIFRFVKK